MEIILAGHGLSRAANKVGWRCVFYSSSALLSCAVTALLLLMLLTSAESAAGSVL
jgi:hypothetical protein